MRNYLMGVTIFIFALGCSKPSEEVKTESFKKESIKKDYVALGLKNLEVQDISNAIKNFSLAIKEAPKDVNNYIILGQVYIRLKNYKEANNMFLISSKLSPKDGDVHFLLALSSLFESKRFESLGEMKLSEQKKEEAIVAAKDSVDIFMANANEERFKKAMSLLKSIVGE